MDPSRRLGSVAAVGRRALAVLLAVVLAACSGGDDGPSDAAPAPTPSEGDEAAPGAGGGEAAATPTGVRIDRSGGRTRFVDDQGREVQLRGANLNVLLDLPQVHADLPPVLPATDEDWDLMAAQGSSVVRLLLSWSALEPERGRIDLAYVQRVQQAVAAAADRGMATVLVLHQEAWGPAVASPPDVPCPEGTQPALGGTGAPAWATLVDDADTCHPPGAPELAPAVAAAHAAFWEDRDGIRTALAATWRQLARAFAAEPAVAGYDLLSRPIGVLPPAEQGEATTDLVAGLLAEVRAGELEGGAGPKVVFVSPLAGFPLPGTLPLPGAVTDAQVALSPDLRVADGPDAAAEMLAAAEEAAGDRGWGLWPGRVGVPGVDDGALATLDRLARGQDAALLGGAHWQWRQRCGDPAVVGDRDTRPEGVVTQLTEVECPADVDAGPNQDLRRVAGRAYPRAVPGRVTLLSTEAGGGGLRVAGTVDDDLAARGDLVLWVPGGDRPRVEARGLGEPELTVVPGGTYVTAEVTDAPWEVTVR